MLGFSRFKTARNTICGIEIMNMLRKGQVVGVAKGNVVGQIEFIRQIFQSTA